ncbi:hypothetical protein [Chryseobacterium gossypii]|uniref:hypothetical protein n=1 Tax=Chryseobacterium gossypii TaxID=3231602 RepID=UPI0035231F21
MKSYSKKLFLLQFLLLIFNGCNYQSQNFINTEFVIDKQNVEDGFYNSKNLDALLKIKGGRYFEPDYTGTSFDNYYVRNIVNDRSDKKNILLFFDKKNILRDTIQIPFHQVYSLNVIFGDNKNGIAIGMFDKKNNYFKINKSFALDKGLKLRPLPIDTKIIHCPIPVDLLSEENLGLEEYFTFGIQSQEEKKTSDTQIKKNFSQWKGSYSSDFKISRIDGDYKVHYIINIPNDEDVFIIEEINGEKNEINDLFIEFSSNDKLVIKSKKDQKLEYIIKYTDEKYYLTGKTIYLLNPPNDRYPLKKEKL